VVGGATCAEPAYRDWVQTLQREGFEIGFHNATYHSSLREATIRGLDEFARCFGHDPRTMATHTTCREGMYWGEHRVSGAHRMAYNLLTRFRQRGVFTGHVESDPYFWGDVCRQRIRFVRSFVFDEINTLKACPFMPYHDADRPWVDAWFCSSEGGRVDAFNHTLAEAAQDRLEEEGGACIMYTHFAKGFFSNGQLQPRFRALMERLAQKNGWFVPVATLLDFLAQRQPGRQISGVERRALERRWLWYKLRAGTT